MSRSCACMFHLRGWGVMERGVCEKAITAACIAANERNMGFMHSPLTYDNGRFSFLFFFPFFCPGGAGYTCKRYAGGYRYIPLLAGGTGACRALSWRETPQWKKKRCMCRRSEGCENPKPWDRLPARLWGDTARGRGGCTMMMMMREWRV